MKYKLLILFFGLITYSSLGQTKEIYLNDELINITESEFKKATEEGTFNMKYDLDTLIINVKVLRIKKGKITKQKLDSIRTYLSNSSDKEINENNTLIINYFPGIDRCNSGSGNPILRKKYSRYLQKINNIENVSQFFVYKSIKGTKKYGKELEWIPDKSTLIEMTFFPFHYNCGSYALIDEDGNFYVEKGEYDIEKIIDLIKNKEKTFGETGYN
jgi:hypothetical protein